MAEYNRRADIPSPPKLSDNTAETFVAYIDYIANLYKAMVLESGVFQQPCGSAEIDETNNAFEVVFSIPQANDRYAVAITAIGSTGSPGVNAFVVKAVTKTRTGFTFQLFAAPGAGNSVTFDWQVQR